MQPAIELALGRWGGQGAGGLGRDAGQHRHDQHLGGAAGEDHTRALQRLQRRARIVAGDQQGDDHLQGDPPDVLVDQGEGGAAGRGEAGHGHLRRQRASGQ